MEFYQTVDGLNFFLSTVHPYIGSNGTIKYVKKKLGIFTIRKKLIYK